MPIQSGENRFLELMRQLEEQNIVEDTSRSLDRRKFYERFLRIAVKAGYIDEETCRYLLSTSEGHYREAMHAAQKLYVEKEITDGRDSNKNPFTWSEIYSGGKHYLQMFGSRDSLEFQRDIIRNRAKRDTLLDLSYDRESIENERAALRRRVKMFGSQEKLEALFSSEQIIAASKNSVQKNVDEDIDKRLQEIEAQIKKIEDNQQITEEQKRESVDQVIVNIFIDKSKRVEIKDSVVSQSKIEQ